MLSNHCESRARRWTEAGTESGVSWYCALLWHPATLAWQVTPWCAWLSLHSTVPSTAPSDQDNMGNTVTVWSRPWWQLVLDSYIVSVSPLSSLRASSTQVKSWPWDPARSSVLMFQSPSWGSWSVWRNCSCRSWSNTPTSWGLPWLTSREIDPAFSLAESSRVVKYFHPMKARIIISLIDAGASSLMP